jgi:uncharacterized protein (TIGR02646 family)
MIRVEKPQEPQVLRDNKSVWTAELLQAIHDYGAIGKAPKSLLNRYNKDEIRALLFESSYHKCAYCEGNPTGTSYLEIDHFRPKSLYPKETFEWDNMIPSCHICNNTKSTHDTVNEPIINPYNTDPETVFYFDTINIVAIQGCGEAQKTIEICGLNDMRLLSARAVVFAQFIDYINKLKQALSEWQCENDNQKKQNKYRNIRKAISRIETLTVPQASYAGLCRSLLKQNVVFQSAKAAVE